MAYLAETEDRLSDLHVIAMEGALDDEDAVVAEMTREQNLGESVPLVGRAAVAHDLFLLLIRDAERALAAHTADPSSHAAEERRNRAVGAVHRFHSSALNDDLPLANAVGPEAAARAAARYAAHRRCC